MAQARISMVLLAALLLLPLGSCKDDDPPLDANRDPFGFDVSGANVVLPPFAVSAHPRPSLAAVGAEVTLRAGVVAGDDTGAVFAWKLPKEASVVGGGGQTGPEVKVSFAQPGDHLVEVSATVGGETAAGGVLVHVVEGTKPALGTLTGGASPAQADVDLLAQHLDGGATLTAKQSTAADLDLSGDVDAKDLELLRSAVKAQASAPIYLSKTSVAALSHAFIIHPALLDPTKEARVRLTTTAAGAWDQTCLDHLKGGARVDEIQARRARPGYLVFSIPLRYACLSKAHTVKVELSSGGDVWLVAKGVTINPLPEASEEPGWRVIEAMARLRVAISSMPKAASAYASEVGATADQKATLQGAARAAAKMFDRSYADFYAGFLRLDRPTRAAWERLEEGLRGGQARAGQPHLQGKHRHRRGAGRHPARRRPQGRRSAGQPARQGRPGHGRQGQVRPRLPGQQRLRDVLLL